MESESYLRKLAAAHNFRLDALDANRAGHLTPEQHRQHAKRLRGSVWLLLFIGVILIGVGRLPIKSDPDGDAVANSILLTVVGISLVLCACYTAFRGKSARDLQIAAVANSEGYIRKEKNTSSDAPDIYLYHLDGRTFSVEESGYEALDTTVRYRVYFLPQSDEIVNIEPVGAPLPAELFSLEEISALVGQPMKPHRLSEDKPSDNDFCRKAYVNSAGTLLVGYGCQLSMPAASMVLLKMGAPIANLGDSATLLAGQLIVRQGSTLVTAFAHDMKPSGIQNWQVGEHPDLCKRIAKTLLAKLE